VECNPHGVGRFWGCHALLIGVTLYSNPHGMDVLAFRIFVTIADGIFFLKRNPPVHRLRKRKRRSILGVGAIGRSSSLTGGPRKPFFSRS
jgi:hypothetical protein